MPPERSRYRKGATDLEAYQEQKKAGQVAYGDSDYLKAITDYNKRVQALNEKQGGKPKMNGPKQVGTSMTQRVSQADLTKMLRDLDSEEKRVGIKADPAKPDPNAKGSPSQTSQDQQARDLGKYETKLTPDEEIDFQDWKKHNAPSDSGADYDLRGAYKAGMSPDEKGHWPDKFKKPNHPTFSDQSQYAKGSDARFAGKWEGDKFIPPSEQYPKDTPLNKLPPPQPKPTGLAPGEQIKDITITEDIKGQGTRRDKSGKVIGFDHGYKKGQVVGSVRKVNDFEKAGDAEVAKLKSGMLKDPKYGYRTGYGFSTPEQEAQFNKDFSTWEKGKRAEANDKAFTAGEHVAADPLNVSKVPTNTGFPAKAERNGETADVTIKGPGYLGDRGNGVINDPSVMGSAGDGVIQTKDQNPEWLASAGKSAGLNPTPTVDDQRELLREEVNHTVQQAGGPTALDELASVTPDMLEEFKRQHPGYAEKAAGMDPAAADAWLRKEVTARWGGAGTVAGVTPNPADRISGLAQGPAGPFNGIPMELPKVTTPGLIATANGVRPIMPELPATTPGILQTPAQKLVQQPPSADTFSNLPNTGNVGTMVTPTPSIAGNTGAVLTNIGSTPVDTGAKPLSLNPAPASQPETPKTDLTGTAKTQQDAQPAQPAPPVAPTVNPSVTTQVSNDEGMNKLLEQRNGVNKYVADSAGAFTGFVKDSLKKNLLTPDPTMKKRVASRN